MEQQIIPVRWLRLGNTQTLTLWNESANRPLNVLFMASSLRGMKPELAFEEEEARILTATRRKPLSLHVEDSGCLQELGYLVEDYERGFFDVIHLTGHATSHHDKPCFVTETEFGEPAYSSAEDIAEALAFNLPRLMFLSGCRAGYSKQKGTLPAIAEQLLKQGKTAVVGWGDRVLDTDATTAAATLYEALAAGKTVAEALALTYRFIGCLDSRHASLCR